MARTRINFVAAVARSSGPLPVGHIGVSDR